MAWAVPEFSRRQVNWAGKVLVEPDRLFEDVDLALSIIGNWRSSHSFPLNTLQIALRKLAGAVDEKPLIAQRIKRLTSIHAKLDRFPTMNLAQMQDIGGCRAIVRDVPTVYALASRFRHSSMRHELDHVDDYVAAPQSSGYRGVHLIYKYVSDRSEQYNGLKIEVQLRSKSQHAWATAVETVGTFLRQALKSSRGEQEWLRFFALMGSFLAAQERTAYVPSTPTELRELQREIRALAESLSVARRLEGYRKALTVLQDPRAQSDDYFLLKLEPEKEQVTVEGFRRRQLAVATQRYLETEKALSGNLVSEVVLVSVDSIGALRKAYPNYFLDTANFLQMVRTACRIQVARSSRRPRKV